jgi:hypothetical protein
VLSHPAHFSSEQPPSLEQPCASTQESFLSHPAHFSAVHSTFSAFFAESLLHAHEAAANIAAAIINEMKIFFMAI